MPTSGAKRLETKYSVKHANWIINCGQNTVKGWRRNAGNYDSRKMSEILQWFLLRSAWTKRLKWSDCYSNFLVSVCHLTQHINPLPVQFKSLLPGQEGCVFSALSNRLTFQLESPWPISMLMLGSCLYSADMLTKWFHAFSVLGPAKG
jgi:hypothetical protein